MREATIRGRAVCLAMTAMLMLSLTACQQVNDRSTRSPSGRSSQTAVMDTVQVTFMWRAPTTGSEVVYYEVETSEGWIFTTDHISSYGGGGKIRVPFTSHGPRIRVRGVDANGVRGPWSEWSDTPGKPDIQRREEP